MAMIAIEQGGNADGPAEAWEPLNKACKEALENTEDLQARLVWCEQNFESRRLTPAVVSERRLWDEGAEVKLRGGE
jgi:hypothetical protein